MKSFENRTSSDLLILILALISVSIHLLVIGNLEYHRDELLYFSLNKYLVGLLFAGLIVIIPFTEYREVFRKKMFWAGLAAGFVIFLPNFIWQI